MLLAAALTTAGCLERQSEPGEPEPTGAPAEWDAEVAWEPCPELPQEALSQAMPAGVLPRIVVEVLAGVAAGVLASGRTYECGTLPVPQDWAAPEEGETLELALVRVRAGGGEQERLGSLVINPGGPGASGVDAAAYLSLRPLVGGLPDEVTDRFDVVGFDPRGVARSSPVDCLTDTQLDESFGADPDPAADAEFDQAVAAAQERVDSCDAAHGDTLGHYSTRQTAHDLDAIRAALGDEQLTYLGYSYGTLLGAVYAHLYPEHVRAMVLDGAVDPAGGEAGSGGQAAGFERAFDNFAAWCAQSPGRCPLGDDARAAVTDAIAQARQAPVPGPDGRDATAGWVFWAVVSALYVEDLWPQLATAIDDLSQGDPTGVFTLADLYSGRDSEGSYPNMFDANKAINCADNDSEQTVDQVRDLQQEWREQYPLFGAPLAVMGLDCVLWPTDPDPYPYGPAEGSPPIVVIGTTGDPATPYESTPRLAELLGTGVVVTYEGEGHTVYPQSGCINDAVNGYLVELAAPEDGLTCS